MFELLVKVFDFNRDTDAFYPSLPLKKSPLFRTYLLFFMSLSFYYPLLFLLKKLGYINYELEDNFVDSNSMIVDDPLASRGCKKRLFIITQNGINDHCIIGFGNS